MKKFFNITILSLLFSSIFVQHIKPIDLSGFAGTFASFCARRSVQSAWSLVSTTALEFAPSIQDPESWMFTSAALLGSGVLFRSRLFMIAGLVGLGISLWKKQGLMEERLKKEIRDAKEELKVAIRDGNEVLKEKLNDQIEKLEYQFKQIHERLGHLATLDQIKVALNIQSAGRLHKPEYTQTNTNAYGSQLPRPHGLVNAVRVLPTPSAPPISMMSQN